MSVIAIELEEVQKVCTCEVPNSRLIACTVSPPAPFVRVDIQEKQVSRQLTACLRFPADGSYPVQPLLVELKSRHLDTKFLDGLTTLCEAQAQQLSGKPQVLHVLRFIQRYLQENALCVCFGEIQRLRRDLGADAGAEQLKLKQRSATVKLSARSGAYLYSVRAVVPDDYPLSCVQLTQTETNLPAVLLRYLRGQSTEIARQCVEPPLRQASGATGFQPQPSLYLALKFCLEAARDFPTEECPICQSLVLPVDPQQVPQDENCDAFVERVYCGHIYHQGCLRRYLQEPPFPKSGKLCPAKCRHPRSDARYYLGGGGNAGVATSSAQRPETRTCGIRLAHDRWVVSVQLAESRWAQKQARDRELQEVVDFFK